MKTVMLFGTFDILHLGHIDMFLQAKKYGEHLIVVVARDLRVEQVKGERPVHSEKERAALLSHLDCVDTVVLGDLLDVYQIIARKKPDVIALGYDQTCFVDKLSEKIASYGLDSEVVRLLPYKEKKYKSGLIKDSIYSRL
tara:strand:+ start:174 stop:593 length:420 start_codon:yes stop_codon:yes gene_type:complete